MQTHTQVLEWCRQYSKHPWMGVLRTMTVGISTRGLYSGKHTWQLGLFPGNPRSLHLTLSRVLLHCIPIILVSTILRLINKTRYPLALIFNYCQDDSSNSKWNGKRQKNRNQITLTSLDRTTHTTLHPIFHVTPEALSFLAYAPPHHRNARQGKGAPC